MRIAATTPWDIRKDCKVLLNGVDVTARCMVADDEAGEVQLIECSLPGKPPITKLGIHNARCSTLLSRKPPLSGHISGLYRGRVEILMPQPAAPAVS